MGVNASGASTVYIVTDGEYSDRDVRGVFSTREKAEAARDFWDANEAIWEWKVDDDTRQLPPGMFAYAVPMCKNGDAPASKCSGNPYKPFRCDGADVERGEVHRLYDGNCAAVKFYVYARDEEHAVKIANERRLAMLAAGQWPDKES